MARCQRCGAATEDGTLCARCGSACAPAGATPGAAGAGATYSVLARANLLRMRARWEEAASLCAEVLRLEPGNASAHSLLGDIHENQGNLEEAVHWYDLALSLNPQSEADTAKRSRVQELLEARRRRAEWQAAIQSRGRAPGAAGALRETVQRIVMVALSAVCAGILVTAAVLSASGSPDSTASDTEGARPRPPSHQIPMGSSAREAHLWQELSLAGVTSTDHGQLPTSGLMIDPATDILTLRILVNPRVLREPTLPAIRLEIEHDCYWIAYQVHLRDRALSAIRVIALGDTSFSGVPGQDWLFTATLRPENLLVVPTTRQPTREDLASFYEKPLWNRLLAG